MVDGAGNPWFHADVGVAGDRIAVVGPVSEPAARTIDADGLVVCPGFVDMHTHSDIQLLANPAHEAKVHQGVTLDVIGQDGLAYAPVTDDVLARLRVQLASWNDDPPGFDWSWRSVAEYLSRFDGRVAINVAYLVPHGTVRMISMGMDDRAPTDAELADMMRLVRQGLDEGAVGLSTGLTYAPAMYATDDELVELCSVMRGTGAYYTPHHRSYGRGAIEAYGACIEIVRRAGVPLHYAHAHLGFPMNRGRAPELLAMVDAAREEGIDVTMDTYPYLAGVDRAAHVRARLGAGRRPRRGDRAASPIPTCASASGSRWRRRAPTGSTAGPRTGRCSTSRACSWRRIAASWA